MSMLDEILASIGQTGGGEGGQPQGEPIDSPYIRNALMRGLMATLAARQTMPAAAPTNAQAPNASPPRNPGTNALSSLGGRAPIPQGGEAAPMPTYAERPNPSPISEVAPEPQQQTELVPTPPPRPFEAPQPDPVPVKTVQTLSLPADQMPPNPIGQQAQPQQQASPNAKELFPQAEFAPGVMERMLGTLLGAPGDTSWLPGGARDQVARQQGSTVKALIAKGMDPRAAEAAALNPDIMRQLAPVIFGAKQNAEWKPIGNDKYGAPQYGWVNPNNQEVRDARGNLIGSPQQPGGAEPQHSGPDLSGLTGKDLLDKLDPGDRNQVQAILDGRQQPPSPNARNARTQRIMEWVAQAEPGFDMTTWKARNTLRTELSSTRPGTAGGAIQALDTAMSHLDRLQKRADSLDNWTFPGSTLARDYLTNPIARNMEGVSNFNEREAAFNTDRKAVLDEAAKVFAGNSTMFDRKTWEEKLNAAQTPGAQREVIREIVGLMKGRVEAIAQSSNRTLGGDKTPYDFIAPTTAAKMKKILGEQ